jgi:hypothetical protein
MRAAGVDLRLNESCRSWRRWRDHVTLGDRETVDAEWRSGCRLEITEKLGTATPKSRPDSWRSPANRLTHGTGSSRVTRFHCRRPQVARTRGKSPECRDRQHGGASAAGDSVSVLGDSALVLKESESAMLAQVIAALHCGLCPAANHHNRTASRNRRLECGRR